jgi:hypothetical protein
VRPFTIASAIHLHDLLGLRVSESGLWCATIVMSVRPYEKGKAGAVLGAASPPP